MCATIGKCRTVWYAGTGDVCHVLYLTLEIELVYKSNGGTSGYGDMNVAHTHNGVQDKDKALAMLEISERFSSE